MDVNEKLPRGTSLSQPLDAVDQELVRRHLGLAHRLAWKYYLNCSRRVPLDELQAEALFGLVYAASLFEPQRHVPFVAYANMAISHKLIHAIKLWRSRGRTNQVAFTDLGGHTPGEFDSPCRHTRDSVDRVGTRELVDRVRGVLPPRWFQALQLYYAQGHTLEEVGDHLGVTRERVRQLLNKAMGRVRETTPAPF